MESPLPQLSTPGGASVGMVVIDVCVSVVVEWARGSYTPVPTRMGSGSRGSSRAGSPITSPTKRVEVLDAKQHSHPCSLRMRSPLSVMTVQMEDALCLMPVAGSGSSARMGGLEVIDSPWLGKYRGRLVKARSAKRTDKAMLECLVRSILRCTVTRVEAIVESGECEPKNFDVLKNCSFPIYY